jgi:hypothetical protein
MKVQELYDLLEEAIEAGKADVEIKIAHQPGYPLAARIANVLVPGVNDDSERGCDPEDDDDECDGCMNCCDDYEESNGVVWIAATDATEYAPRAAWGD